MAISKSAIVTGAAGFIGVHLCERLLQNGYEVIGVDNFSTGSQSNISYLKSLNHDFHFFESDIVESWDSWLSKLPKSSPRNLKYIFHFASPASPLHFEKMNLEILKVNSIGLENAIKFADKNSARVIFASTSEIYGDPEISPQPEHYWGYTNSFGPRSCYDEGKRFGEALIYSSNKRNNTKHGLVRIFNTYGPRMRWDDGRVIINFLKQALRGSALTIYGDGTQTRSFCYIDDLVSGILVYAEKNICVPLNLGNQTEFQVLDLAKKIQYLFTDKKIDFVYEILPSEDPKKRRPDLTQTLQHLDNWKPTVDLDQGLKMTLEWMKQNI